jgi:hypothetical protein
MAFAEIITTGVTAAAIAAIVPIGCIFAVYAKPVS